MLIYVWGSPGKPPTGNHTIFVAPAALTNDVPEEWWDHADGKKKPKEFAVQFYKGTAEVEDRLGKFMIEYKMAMKSRLVRADDWSS